MNIIGKKIVDVRWAEIDEISAMFSNLIPFVVVELDDGTILQAKIEETDTTLGDVKEILERIEHNPGNNFIVLTWSVEDIILQANAEKIDITVEDAREILKRIEHNYDPDIGVNWGVIDTYIKEYIEKATFQWLP